MIIAIGVEAVKTNPNLLDDIFNNSLLSKVMPTENGKYNLDNISTIINNVMDEYGTFPINIKFIRNPLIFNKRDVEHLMTCIKEEVEDGGLQQS